MDKFSIIINSNDINNIIYINTVLSIFSTAYNALFNSGIILSSSNLASSAINLISFYNKSIL